MAGSFGGKDEGTNYTFPAVSHHEDEKKKRMYKKGYGRMF
jgi:hypothetical protein